MSRHWNRLVIAAAVVLAGCTPTPGTPSGSTTSASPSPVASASAPAPAAAVPQSTTGALTDAQIDAFIACAQSKPDSADKINLMRAYKTAPEPQKITSRPIIESHARSLGCL